MSEHDLVWKYTKDGRPCGSDALLGWQLLASRGAHFRRYEAGKIGDLATSAVEGAIGRNVSITVAWGNLDPATATPQELGELFGNLQPCVIVCPARPLSAERRVIEEWAIIDGQTPTILPTNAAQAALQGIVAKLYPRWEPRQSYGSQRETDNWMPTCLMVRPDLSAEQLGLLEPEALVGDRLLNEISCDADVRAAFRAEDVSLPETTYRLARAQIDAMKRRGIPEREYVFMHSGVAETLLTPVLSSMRDDLTVIQQEGANPGEKIPVLTILRQKLKPYGELRDLVLCSILRDYAVTFPHLDRLREAARATAAAAA
jgi:hypothetical protein